MRSPGPAFSLPSSPAGVSLCFFSLFIPSVMSHLPLCPARPHVWSFSEWMSSSGRKECFGVPRPWKAHSLETSTKSETQSLSSLALAMTCLQWSINVCCITSQIGPLPGRFLPCLLFAFPQSVSRSVSSTQRGHTVIQMNK